MKYKCRLKSVLAELNIKHGDFADKIGVDKSTISAMANNKSLPSFDTLYMIMEELERIDPNLKFGDIWVKVDS
ncbi:helix-turn-helix domain-containing protein [Heyndrickxia oleronia]|jgi:DNA-binding XRE family transcriptional regulator|uniref:helix-turn-helix domain-containing protein n=1 Tax=Heyndrickxia oleronia TaxID=38875 RepID=UPI00242B1F65|nr:helix-turn-helix transcriptional regulator [Heyndrickxia oleronia]MCI1590372.1 helix-turn-helix transcriptional regulator [Heyndrickxia oleronia]MCI1611366.1 helix-turn-helix transcriptional regulator [Heyndrickxia oleronia]MCI1742809.1 helix-turn-helix transcriptional regulator [Heyndrickxia oleronia]MCI1763106.1 helix-turn-helix transcriptional regulator [Heyndrickxia oleronia]